MSTSSVRSAKTQQINFRATTRQAETLRRAAAASDATLTDFVLSSAMVRAEQVLADRRWFVVTNEEWAAFAAAIDEPLASTVRFRELKQRPDPFTDDE
ncbi:MAG: DUF1778 domain-containing protein [Actinobacteria bacterium]|nr:DUF1778 domain-containing protein [Actinomycetota bacterium]